MEKGKRYWLRRDGAKVITTNLTGKEFISDNDPIPNVWEVKGKKRDVRSAQELDITEKGVIVEPTAEGLMELDVKRVPITVKVTSSDGLLTKQEQLKHDGRTIKDHNKPATTLIADFFPRKIGVTLAQNARRNGGIYLARSLRGVLHELKASEDPEEVRLLKEGFMDVLSRTSFKLDVPNTQGWPGQQRINRIRLSSADKSRGAAYSVTMVAQSGDTDYELRVSDGLRRMVSARDDRSLDTIIMRMDKLQLRFALEATNSLLRTTEKDGMTRDTKSIKYMRHFMKESR